MKFIVFAPGYDPDSGGSVALHKLCHVLNSLGHECSICPARVSKEVNRRSFIETALLLSKDYIKSFAVKYETNHEFDTPLFYPGGNPVSGDYIVIYSEAVHGNPLSAKNVVRWFLHKPGFHTGAVCYGIGELYFDFRSFATGFCIPGSRLSPNPLYVTQMPFDLYSRGRLLPSDAREGTAYCLRKGKGRAIQHDLDDSILIDNLPHREVSRIFSRVKTFISYDLYTAYCPLAAISGADVVVVPDPDLSCEEWYPEEAQRYGLAYGFGEDQMSWARRTSHMVLDEFMQKERRVADNVADFAREAISFFAK